MRNALMAFHPLTPGEPPPEPFRPQAWHGLVVIGALIVAIPGAVLLARRGPPAPVPDASGAYSDVRDTALGGAAAEGLVDLDSSNLRTLAIYTIPVGVEVTIDGQPAGVTPFRSSDFERRTYRISLAAHGYLPVDTAVHLDTDPTSLLAVDLLPDPTRPRLPPAPAPGETPAPPTAPVDERPGELSVAVVPWGSIYLDGQLVARETDVRQTYTLPPGPHRVAAEHPTLGRTEVTVQIQPGRTRTLSIELSP